MCILLILVVLSIKFTATSALAWGGAYPEKWADPETGAFSWDLYCSDPANAKNSCCGKGGGSKCWCGCSVKYCTYDKNGKNGKCNGHAEAPKYELLGGGGYIGKIVLRHVAPMHNFHLINMVPLLDVLDMDEVLRMMIIEVIWKNIAGV